jgi:uncharacterized protein
MALKISDIPPQGITLEISDKLDLFEAGQASTPFRATMTIKPGPRGTFQVTGTVDAEAQLECSRCLRPFPFSVKGAVISIDLLPEGTAEGHAERELGRSELDSEFYREDEIEPQNLVREQVLLALPMVPVHSPDCKGLCPVCGTDRNEKECGCRTGDLPAADNPFAVLKKIIKSQKE